MSQTHSFQGGFTDIGIPRDSFNHSRDKDFGSQVISSLQLLSMKKPVTDEGFYHCEGSYDFGESVQKSKENRSDEESSAQQSEEGAGEVKMDIVDTEQLLLSAQESKKTDLKENLSNREDEGRGIRGKKKPNVFIAVELDNPEIIQKMQDMQDQACQFDPKLKSNAVPLKKAHITLLVANVQEEELPKARAVISKTFRDNLAKIVPENQFTVEIKGVDSFGEKVVFAEIDQGKSFLMQLNEELLRAFEDADFDCDSRYTPHVTILKVKNLLTAPFLLKVTMLNYRLATDPEEEYQKKRTKVSSSRSLVLRRSREPSCSPCTRNKRRRVTTTLKENTSSRTSSSKARE